MGAITTACQLLDFSRNIQHWR